MTDDPSPYRRTPRIPKAARDPRRPTENHRAGDDLRRGLSWPTCVFIWALSHVVMAWWWKPMVCHDHHTRPSAHESDLNTNLAWKHSLGFFGRDPQEIPNEVWIRDYQEPAWQALSRMMMMTDGDAEPESLQLLNHQDPVPTPTEQWLFTHWDPYFVCPHLVKVGGLLQGGAKWVCDPERWFQTTPSSTVRVDEAPCLVYSIGSRGNFDFEEGLYHFYLEQQQQQEEGLRAAKDSPTTSSTFSSSSLGCEIHIFDPKPSYGNSRNASWWSTRRMHYHPWGLQSSYSPLYSNQLLQNNLSKTSTQAQKGSQLYHRYTYYTFDEIRRRLGHANRTIHVLKIDCESCEWHTYLDWVKGSAQQILMETHELPRPDRPVRTDFGTLPQMHPNDLFQTVLQHGYVLYAKQVNSQKGRGRSVEWSFLRLDASFFRAPTTKST